MTTHGEAPESNVVGLGATAVTPAEAGLLAELGLSVGAYTRVSAALIWSQRHNPVWLDVRTFIGVFQRFDPAPEGTLAAWESTDQAFFAQLKRATHGDHVYLVLWHRDQLLGTYDAGGWHDGSERPRRKPADPHVQAPRLPLVA